VAAEIVRSLGGDIEFFARRVAGAFDFLFHFVQLKDKNQKRLNSIYEMSYDSGANQIHFRIICRYNPVLDCWTFYNQVGEEKQEMAMLEAPEAWASFCENLKNLALNQEVCGEGLDFSGCRYLGDDYLDYRGTLDFWKIYILWLY
jgi:hypothetical protein